MAAVAPVALMKLGGHRDLCDRVAFMMFVIVVVLYGCRGLYDGREACADCIVRMASCGWLCGGCIAWIALWDRILQIYCVNSIVDSVV